ncbi:MAG TPA: hypothetical protein PKE43_10465 [Anaerolineales bacterium]|nr:hypothetical protein [Anaerolineales bacterium]
MPESEYRARQVRAKTNEVFEYDRDDEKPGKPLHILIPGGLIALATLALIVFIAYQTWFEGNLAENIGLILVVILSPFYVGGVFLFSYGYELYNIPRALRLTAIIVFVTLAAVVIVAVLFFLLANMNGSSGSKSSSSNSSKGGKSRSSSSSSSSKPSNSPRPSTGKMGGIVGAAGAALNRSSTNSSSSNSSSSSGYSSGGHVYIGGGETREVTKEVVKEVPKEPMPVTCPFCARSYVPVENNYICPSCGAATPRELIKESQEPK